MLLEGFAPTPDASEIHRIKIAAPPQVVYRVLWTADLGRSPLVKMLLALRSLPTLFSTRAKGSSGQELTLQAFIDAGFGRLAEEPEREIVLGVSGRFWRPTGNLEPFAREAFSRPVPRGMAQAVWNFSVLPAGDRGSILTTETRVTCGDTASRFKFRLYWLVIKPLSGLIRVIMLRAVRHAAESRPA